MTGTAADWTTGAPALAYQACGACGATWYFARGFCPRCGAAEPATRQASGRGTVYAVTTVTRAPSPELRALAPYRIALVDMAEGFRAMVHAASGVAIGDAVQTRFVPFGALAAPICEPAGPGPAERGPAGHGPAEHGPAGHGPAEHGMENGA